MASLVLMLVLATNLRMLPTMAVYWPGGPGDVESPGGPRLDHDAEDEQMKEAVYWPGGGGDVEIFIYVTLFLHFYFLILI